MQIQVNIRIFQITSKCKKHNSKNYNIKKNNEFIHLNNLKNIQFYSNFYTTNF
jgi:hypothetical protein